MAKKYVTIVKDTDDPENIEVYDGNITETKRQLAFEIEVPMSMIEDKFEFERVSIRGKRLVSSLRRKRT